MNTIKQRLRAALQHAGRDTRGVALQTVIVIVVLLMIAGGVSAVLLSRSSDVVGQLEAQGVGALTKENCVITSVGGDPGQLAEGVETTDTEADIDKNAVALTAGGDYCTWPSKDVTPAQCFAAANGVLTKVKSADAIGAIKSGEVGCAAKIA